MKKADNLPCACKDWKTPTGMELKGKKSHLFNKVAPLICGGMFQDPETLHILCFS